ncbi:tetratricopeptide repeat protein [Phragmitibacter flavus]|uniref:tetratricopeptide repeat protein n=1 Tax=Phragmitibacter flavus TaxID=2576071 RepID=UPI0010FE8BDF|nr:hypothetical protein [Phragmitibacter flavus]
MVFLAFAPSLTFDFINYDDPYYIIDNPNVNTGLSLANLRWAFGTPGEVNLWNPLTTLSHQLVVSLFGLNPAWHHAVNGLCHALAASLLFLLAVKLTKSLPWSYFIALLWAIHPQKIQSVAWITERKDVLSGALFFASILCFAEWHSRTKKRPALYVASLLLFIAAAMAKPSVLPLPLVLLVLFALKPGQIISSALSSLRQLGPFFAAAVALAAIVVFFQSHGTLSDVGGDDSLFERLRQMIFGYVFYLLRFAFPIPSQFFFTPPLSHLPLVLAIVGLGLFLIAVIWLGRREKLIPVGALIYTLLWLPISGIIPISHYFAADRYSYLPQIGIIIIVIGLARRLSSLSSKSLLLPIALGSLVAGYLVLLQQQLPIWKNSETLFAHEMRVNPREALADIHYGEAFWNNDPAKALVHFELAHQKAPHEGLPLSKMGVTQLRLNQPEQALESFQAATRAANPVVETWTQLLLLQVDLKRYSEAEATVNDGLQRFPNQWPMLMNAGNFHLLVKKDPHQALPLFLKAHEISPSNADSIRACARCYLILGDQPSAARFERLLQLR